MSTVKDIDGERIAKILQFATEAEALPELCNFVDYDPDIGKVPEHWEPKVYVWLVVKHVAESELAAANERIRELEADLKTAFYESWKARAKVTELETSLTAERAVSDRLLEALKLAYNQYMGCGGSLSPNEVVLAMQIVIGNAIAEVESIRKEKPE